MSIFKEIEKSCSRVVINEEGEAVNPKRAKEDHDIVPSIIFWRNDGWSLGAPEEFESVAYEMWEDLWVRYGRSPDFIPEKMESYVPETKG